MILVLLLFLSCTYFFAAQKTSRVSQRIDNNRVSTVRGNLHRFAQPAFDRGPAEDSLPIERITLALKPTDLSADCRVLHVKRSIWHGQEQAPKTPNAVRVIDIAEPLAGLLRECVASKSEYLFSTNSGRPLQQRNVNRALHATGPSPPRP